MIEARGLKRTYKARKKVIEAVQGIDLSVRRGEIVGFLGPNGAGKTTTLKMLCTLLQPTDGEATVAGCDLRRDPEGVRRNIGYVAQGGTTSGLARVGLEIVSQAELFGIHSTEAKKRGLELLHALDLDDIWDRPCGSLSGGQRRRLDIVMGLLHQPALVFLDEPSTGLDPQSRANLWNHIRRLRDEFETTVFLTTHYMDEADSLSDRLLIIDHGRIAGEGTSSELKARISGDSLTFTLRDNEEAAKAGGVAGGLDKAANVVVEGNVLKFQIPEGARALPGFLKALGEQNIDPIGAEIARPTLDDVFLTLTGRSLRD
ncbi:MAG: ATP-binding cassette domain-containing protein [Hyphomicrobiaceae bacterium]|nr:ATP-binding cassette domain-containing protein [Hyphomicrobiaceae bacterium]